MQCHIVTNSVSLVILFLLFLDTGQASLVLSVGHPFLAHVIHKVIDSSSYTYHRHAPTNIIDSVALLLIIY